MSGNSNKQIGGIKKKNGHKLDCNCPICINIKHAKGGAGFYVVDYEKGVKKSKTNCNNPNCKCRNCKCINCNCPNCNCKICKAKKNRRKTKRTNNTKKNRTMRRK
jgi:hypothetical protein